MNIKSSLRVTTFFGALLLILGSNASNAQVCGMYQGQEICTSSAESWSRVTGQTMNQANARQAQYNKEQAAAKALAEQQAAARAASYAAAQQSAAAIHTQNAQNQAALAAAQAKQRDQVALQQLAAKTAAEKAAAQKAADALAAQQSAAQAALNERAKLQTQVASQLTQSGAACNGYWQGGRCVPNNLVAYNGGSPVNVMNQPGSTWAGAGKRQTCTLVYKYVGGRVVGSPQTVCTIQ